MLKLRHDPPREWGWVALAQLDAFLQDHAANERKVSQSALTLVAQLAASCRALGAAEPWLLDLPDGGLAALDAGAGQACIARVLDHVQGRSTWAGGREEEGGAVGRSRWCRMPSMTSGLRDDAQDAQRAATSRALRNVHREDPQQRKSRAPR